MSEQGMIENWFQETTYTAELTNFIQNLKESFLGFYMNRLHEHQELVNSMMKQKIEGKTIDEKTSLKFHFLLGDLQESKRLEGVVDGFIETLMCYVRTVKKQCIEAHAGFTTKDPAFELNSFFISNILKGFENEHKWFLHRLKETNASYADEQLSLSVSLLNKELPEEKKNELNENQALLAGKATRLQSSITHGSNFWQAPYQESLSTILDNMRMALYRYLNENKESIQKKA